MPKRENAPNICNVYATASWWTDDNNDEEVKTSINWQHAQSKMKKLTRSFYPKVEKVKEFVPDFDLTVDLPTRETPLRREENVY